VKFLVIGNKVSYMQPVAASLISLPASASSLSLPLSSGYKSLKTERLLASKNEGVVVFFDTFVACQYYHPLHLMLVLII
jgi:hypothetical protein